MQESEKSMTLKKQNENRFNHNELIINIIFYLAYSIELAILLIDKSVFINPIEGRLFQITFLLFLFVAASYRYTLAEWMILILWGSIGAISYFITERNEIIRFVIFLAACKQIQPKGLIKYTFYVILVGISSLIILSLLGIMGTISSTADFGRGIVETRYMLGIGHPNALHCMFWSIIVLFLYLYDNTLKWWIFGILYVSNFGMYSLTHSKAGVLITIFTITISIFYHYFKVIREHIIVSIFNILLTITCVVFSIFIAIPGTFLTPESTIDRMLTGRLWIARALGGTNKWELFSNPGCTEYFDMGYVRMFYWYGIIPTVLIIILLCILLQHLWKNQNYMELMIILSFVLYTTVEAHAVSVYLARNYVLLILGTSWSNIISMGKQESYLFYQIPVKFIKKLSNQSKRGT